ncbi:histidine phosphatase family protein [Moritella viscosa]|uniref:histidine phosphatase family protein n=1 Tax=Moritella viscosa TaxID=80854 RepID=UPI00406D47D2
MISRKICIISLSTPANNTPPNGESLADFSQRVEVALLNVLQEYQGKRIALFVHSGVIRTLIAWCLKIDYLHGVQFQRIKIEYASISHISVFAHEGEHFPQLGYTNKVVVQKQQNCQKME